MVKMIIMNNMHLFLLFLAVRLASVWLVQTWYVPDEYWQSLEVAHRMSFGYGHLTWEWILGLRSYLYPGIIAFLYKFLELLGLDSVSALIYVPRMCQAMLSAFADLQFYKWTGNHKWAAFNMATSWFWFYTGSRTLTNSVEASITVIALSMFPWKGAKQRGDEFLWLVALNCAIRPTAAIPWFPLCIYHILAQDQNIFKFVLKKYLTKGLIVLSISILLDSLCHGQFIVTSWQFLKLNVLHDVGSWYGSQPWHWYLSNGLPAMLGIHMLPFTIAIVKSLKNREANQTNLILLSSVLFTVVVYSALPHKEFRFLLPLLPMILYISSDLISRWSNKASRMILWFVAAVILVSNIVPAWYLGHVHQRGTIDVMTSIKDIAIQRPDSSFLYLMPCHSTPFYSHVHTNVSMRFLTCEPNLANAEDYKDEADKFYENPDGWLHSHYPPNGTLPSHIITYDVLIPNLTSILSRYKPIERFEHTSVPISKRIGYYVILHELIK